MVIAVAVLCVATAGASASPTQVRVLVVKATWGPQPYTDADIDSARRAAP